MSLGKAFLTFWIGGILAFLVVIALHLPLVITAVPGGMGDHQAAGTAAEVNRIQAAWADAGLLDQVGRAMLSDLIFIGIYGLGAILGGFYFRSLGQGVLRHLGTAILLCGLVFTVTDYGETIAQFLQYLANAGSDDLAGFAATVRPIKMIAFVGSFIGIIAAFIIRRKQQRAG